MSVRIQIRITARDGEDALKIFKKLERQLQKCENQEIDVSIDSLAPTPSPKIPQDEQLETKAASKFGDKLDRLATAVEECKSDQPINNPSKAEADIVGFLDKLAGLGCKVVSVVRNLIHFGGG